MQSLLWFSPLIAVPLVWLQLTPQQPQKSSQPVASPVVFQSASELSSRPPIPKKIQLQRAIARKPLVRTKTKHKPKTKLKPALYTAPSITIRVEVAQNISSIAIASSTNANIIDGNGQQLEPLSPSESFQVSASNSTILFQEVQTPSALWIEPSKGGAVFVGNNWYRGKLLLIAQGNQLLAINYVDLEEYLLSVVGSEMSAAAPMEALKAQAVAARSYALVHTFRPASQWYDLSNDERNQVYQGLSTEYNTTHQAVAETAGEILTYKGGVVESLYGATQAIVDKAHKGAGMSQTGAYAYANQRYNYRQILGAYYPGVAIARLETRKLKRNRD